MMALLRAFSVLVATILAITPADAAPVRYGLNDVTILLPLPLNEAERNAEFLTAQAQVGGRALVPFEFLSALDVAQIASPSAPLDSPETYAAWTVLGVRVDPCFRDEFADACRPQIRLVAQPIDTRNVNPGLPMPVEDSALHLFYDVTPTEVTGLLARLRAARLKTTSDFEATQQALTVSPVILRERALSLGAPSRYQRELRQALLPLVSFRRLSRIAVFLSGPVSTEWLLRSFDVKGGKTTEIRIPGLPGTTTFQILENKKDGPIPGITEFHTRSSPLPASQPGSDQTFDYLNDSVAFKTSPQSLERIRLLGRSLFRASNPRTHLPGTLDCVSCHSEPAIESHLRASLLWNPLSAQSEAFVSKVLPLTAMAGIHHAGYLPIYFRMFGYFISRPLVGQRVVNESAAIVDGLADAGLP